MNISAFTDLILNQTLNEGSWDHLEHISTFRMAFFLATFVLAIFVHIRNKLGLSCARLSKAKAIVSHYLVARYSGMSQARTLLEAALMAIK